MEANESPLHAIVRESRDTAFEQVAAAWQMQVDRVRAELEANWRDQLHHVFEERFAEIENAVREVVELRTREELDRAVDASRASLRSEVTAQLNQVARGLHQAENRDVWIRTFLEATASFCGRAALFAIVSKNAARFEGGLGIGEETGPEIAITDAPALRNAIESKETVVAMATPGELSDALYRLLGLADQPLRKAYLLPMVMRDVVAGVLYAEPSPDGRIDVPGLELLASLAVHSAKIEVTEAPVRANGLISITAPAKPPSSLSKDEQDAHARAQRFARLKVAELLLYKVTQVKRGRADRDIYGTLRGEIDAARESYRNQFMAEGPVAVDYLHQELVGTLGGNDPTTLGPGYPGPLN